MSLTRNKLVVTSAIDAVLGARDLDAIDRFFAADYIQHSATGADGPGALRELLGGMPDEFRYERVRILGDGDLVACHGVYYGAEEWPLAGFDVFRIEGGKLAEHWDNHQRLAGPRMLDGPAKVTLPAQTEATRAVVNAFVDGMLVAGLDPAGLDPAGLDPAGQPAASGWIEHSSGWTGRGYRRRHFTVAEGEFALTGSAAGADVCYDLFRVAGGLIAEHWAVISPVPAVIRHDNGLFLSRTGAGLAGGRVAGLSLAAIAAAMWAIGGIAAQELFAHYGVSPAWLVGMRLSAGGLLLLAVFRPPWPRGHAFRLIAIATVGIAGTQYTWFEAIRHSNVALATFVQYSAVAMTAAWQMAFRQMRPTVARIAAVVAAGTGVWLLAAGSSGSSGSSGGLGDSRSVVVGIAFALASAVAYSFYLLASSRLVQDIGARSATAWGLTIGSVPMLVWAPPWTLRTTGSLLIVATLTAVVAIAATAVAFSLSLASLRHITPTEFAVTSTLEPALAAVIAAILLGVTLGVPQYAGGALTVVAVLLLATTGGAG